MREVPLNRPWKGHQPLYVFEFFSLIFDKSSKFWIPSRKNKSNLLPVRITICMCSNFSAKPCSKNARKVSIVLWITAREWRIPTSRNPNQNRAALWLIFSSNRSAPANRKTGFYEKLLSEQAGGWIQFCMKRLRTSKSFQIFKSEIKISKTYSGWCPFQGLSNGSTLMKI